jgi:serine/threonine protein kinase
MPRYDYEPGDIIRAAADYRVVRYLGAGGMGTVYGVDHCELSRPFAIKTMPSSLAHRDDLKEMFGREARTVAQLGVPNPHPGIVEVVDLGRTRDRGRMPYLVMPWLVGETLRGALDREGSLPVLQCIGIVTHLCEALYHAHERGVVHRDLKPDNIFIPQVSRGVAIQVLDWGISKLVAQADDPSVFLGTPPWASREQLLGEGIGPPSDIYSAGVVLFRCLTGRMPFEEYGTSLEKLLATVSVAAPSIASFGDFPPDLERLVARALSKDPSRRPADALAFAEELQEIGRAFRKSRDPHTHVTDRVQRPTRDLETARPEQITEAKIAPRTIEDPDLPKYVEAERQKLLAQRQWLPESPNPGRHVLSPPHANGQSSEVTGFERTEERRPAAQLVESPASPPTRRERARRDGDREARSEAEARSLLAMRDAPTNLPGPPSAPLGPPASIRYVESAPAAGARHALVHDTVPSAPPRMTVPMGPPRRADAETPAPSSVTVPSVSPGSLGGRAKARWRWFFGSTTWKTLGRPMVLVSACVMLVVLVGIRVGRARLSAEAEPAAPPTAGAATGGASNVAETAAAASAPSTETAAAEAASPPASEGAVTSHASAISRTTHPAAATESAPPLVRASAQAGKPRSSPASPAQRPDQQHAHDIDFEGRAAPAPSTGPAPLHSAPTPTAPVRPRDPASKDGPPPKDDILRKM